MPRRAGRGAYDQGAYYGNNGYEDQSSDSVVVAAQQRLARDGYYRGQIDGVFGPEGDTAAVESARTLPFDAALCAVSESADGTFLFPNSRTRGSEKNASI